MSPLFSIITPLYNKEDNVENTINSVLAQSLQSFELIIINDGSTDNSLKIAEAIIEPRIKVFSKTNEGVSLARNFGVSKANGKFVAFLDADDLWKPNHLEVMNSLIRAYPKNKWFATRYEIKHHDGLVSPMKTHLLDDDFDFEGVVDNYFKNSLVSSLAWTSAVVMEKSFFEELDGFNKKIGNGEDTDLWIRAALKSPLVFSSIITVQYNLTGINRVSHLNTSKKSFLDIDTYDIDAKTNFYLKKYLDINRFSIGLQYRLSGDEKMANDYFKKIDDKNLNRIQKLLMSSPRSLLKFMLKIQSSLRKLNINLTAFK